MISILREYRSDLVLGEYRYDLLFYLSQELKHHGTGLSQLPEASSTLFTAIILLP